MKSIRRTLCAGLVLLGACQDNATAPGGTPAMRIPAEGPTLRGEVRTGWITGPDGRPMEVTFEVHDGRALLEGDIDLGPADSIPATPAGVRVGGPRYGVIIDGAGYRWGQVAYTISTSFTGSERQTILNAIAHVSANHPDIYFTETSSVSPRIHFAPDAGTCSSPVGMQGGVQTIKLAPGCAGTMGIVVHEVLHSLGMWHEQSRCDRDGYVQINLQNVESGKSHNFDKKCSGSTDIGSYDEGSIMHYGAYAFSANGLPTITSLRGLPMGQRTAMSAMDVRTVDWMYPRSVALSMSYPSNVPTVSWTAYREATHYQVYFVESEEIDDYERGRTYQEYSSSVGTSYGTSITDASRSYTGIDYCYDDADPYYVVTRIFEYEVWAYSPYVPGGVKKNRVPAQVGYC